MTDYVDELRRAVAQAEIELLRVPSELAERRPAPGRWSPKEIIGHLIDSASNNHQRFVRARWMDDLVFEGYEQDAWVAAQRYQDAPWRHLVTLWAEFNRHLATVMEVTPQDVRSREHRRHNLHLVAWRTLSPDEPATLDYFMRDYVGHLQHHLRQVRQLLSLPG